MIRLKQNNMKNILILLFLISPFVCVAQSQVINGVDINGPKGFVKSGNLTWSKGNDNVGVVVTNNYTSPAQRKNLATKTENRYTTFLFGQDVEVNGVNRHIGVYKANDSNGNIPFVGIVAIERGGNTYVVTASSLCVGNEYEKPAGSDRTLGQAAITQVFYILGYMIERVSTY